MTTIRARAFKRAAADQRYGPAVRGVNPQADSRPGFGPGAPTRNLALRRVVSRLPIPPEPEEIVPMSATILNALDLSPHRFSLNLSSAELIERSVAAGEGKLAANGATVCLTGDRTGRSPNDKFLEDV